MKLTNNLYFYPEKGMLDCNTYVIKGDLSILIDAGSTQFLPALVHDLQKDGIEPEEIDIITNTHLHGDHCGANEVLKGLSGAKILAHQRHREFYDVTVFETAKFFGFPPIESKEDGYLDNGKMDIGDMESEFIHTPGHSPDSICFYCRREEFLICGDVIFDKNTGRVDLPGGNADELKRSIKGLSSLKIKYLLPGHMGIVNGAEEVKGNFEFVTKHVLG